MTNGFGYLIVYDLYWPGISVQPHSLYYFLIAISFLFLYCIILYEPVSELMISIALNIAVVIILLHIFRVILDLHRDYSKEILALT